MENFGNFLYELRKEKGMTQADLALALGVTNKAVSKWETGEAMPETSLLLPIARIFDVTCDELLAGKRSEKERSDDEDDDLEGSIKQHLFTRGKEDEENKTLSDKICRAICTAVFLGALGAYLFIGAFASLWHPYWVIVPLGAFVCGIIGIVFDWSNKEKRAKKIERGENPHVGYICGLIMLSCLIAYLVLGATSGLWHPLWIIVIVGVVATGILGAAGEAVTHRKRNNEDAED